MVKQVFPMSLRALQGFVDLVFRRPHVPLSCSPHICISRRAKEVEVSFKTAPNHRCDWPLGLWRRRMNSKNPGTDGRRRKGIKLYITVDSSTHEIIAAGLSTDGEVIPNLLKHTRRSTLAVSGDCAYDTRACHATMRLNDPLL